MKTADAPGARPCERCASGPTGPEGHERLSLLPRIKHATPPPHFVLRCLDCGMHWRREFAAGPSIRWLRLAACAWRAELEGGD